MSVDSPWRRYQAARNQGFVADAAQQRAVERLQECYRHLEAGQPARGVYLWGPVGRGKTWLMDSFYNALSVPARRLHFHHVMTWLHRRLFQLHGTADPLTAVATELAGEIRVLCFDEFFVSDIANAMLLGRFLNRLFLQDVTVIATSNDAPDDLYKDGFNRKQFLPAIAAIKAHMQVVHLDGGQDHRLHGRRDRQRYWLTDARRPGRFACLFRKQTGQPPSAGSISINGRSLPARGASPDTLWCTYDALCGGHWSAADYVLLCRQYQVLLLSDVPDLSAEPARQFIARGTEDGAERVDAGDRELTVLSARDNSVRRFIALVDECYEQQVLLYMEAARPLAELYRKGGLLHPFQRTRSRLEAMQRKAFEKRKRG